MNKLMKRIMTFALALAIGAPVALAAPTASAAQSGNTRMTERIRKQLVTLPYSGIFDNLSFQFDGNTVTLFGQVTSPTTKRDAERRVAKLEGVEQVVNKIEVLPVSPFDNSIRVRTYRAIARQSGMYRYFLGANSSLRIIVNRGHVTLEGVVANKMDSQLAYMGASSVPGVFSVTNHLRVERE